jgi:arsenate reductase-like glutaredoxin family protein
MVKERVNLKRILSASGIENLLSDRFKEWQDLLTNQSKIKLSSDMMFIYRYKIYYQITGILGAIMDWFKNDMPISIDELIKLLNYLTVDTKTLYANVPNITIKILDS